MWKSLNLDGGRVPQHPSYNLGAGYRPSTTGGEHFGALSPQITACVPQARNVPTKRGLCPKQSNRPSATGVHFRPYAHQSASCVPQA